MQILLIVFLCYLVHNGVCYSPSPKSPTPGKATKVLPLSVQGNQILIGGKPGSLVGNSFFWSNNRWGGEKFFNKKVVQWLKTDWMSQIIRAPLGIEAPGGSLEDPKGNKARVMTLVDAAIEYGMHVIIDWHSHECKHTDKAIQFFTEMAKKYSHVNNVIYEIVNEPKNDTWKANIKPYALAVIKAIRDIDKKNLIVVGTAKWSQEVGEAAADPITGYINIAYTLHFYAASHKQPLRDKASEALKKIALFVTEWGTTDTNGGKIFDKVESDAWVRFMKAHKLSSANWAINEKAEACSALKPGASPAGGWPVNNLTESGKYVREMIRNWYK